MWHAIRGKPPWKHPQLVNKNHCRDTMKVSHVDSVFAQQRTIDPGSRERTWPTGPALEKESSLPKLPKGRLQSRVNAHSFFNIKSQQIRRLLSTSKVINIHNKHQFGLDKTWTTFRSLSKHLSRRMRACYKTVMGNDQPLLCAHELLNKWMCPEIPWASNLIGLY